MKQIKAIIRPHMLERVIAALHELPHFPGCTTFDAKGQGRGRGQGGEFKATEESIFQDKRVVLELITTDELADSIAAIVEKSAHTGYSGDGLIIVTDIQRVVRIRSGETQEKAV